MLILFLWHDEGTLHSECEDTGDFVSAIYKRLDGDLSERNTDTSIINLH